MAQYTQPPLSIQAHIALLQERGLVIDDLSDAEHWLSHIGYFRLNLYAPSFKLTPNKFIEGTKLVDIVNLYSFDRDLKLIIFNALETIEVALKALISNSMSESFGAHWYLDPNCFSPKYDHASMVTFLEKECTIDSDVHFISRYRKQYDDPHLPPSWMIMEILTFGKLSLMFEHLNSDQKNGICHDFKLAKNILPSWLHCFTYIRNICAHHATLAYRAITIEPIMPTRSKLRFLEEAEEVDNTKLYCVLCCLQFLVRQIDSNSSFTSNLLALINTSSHIDYSRLGFTTGWRKEDIWL